MEDFVPKIAAIFVNQKCSLAKSPCIRAGIHHLKPRFEGILLMVASFLLLVQVASLHGTMEQSTRKEGIHYSEVYAIDENFGLHSTLTSFYIMTEVHESCAVYICYLSQLDEHYKLSDENLQIRAGFTLRNLKHNEITQQCNPTEYKRLNTDTGNIPQPKAWHGIKVAYEYEHGMHKQEMVRIQTSFSDEIVYLDYTDLTAESAETSETESKSIQIHFGTTEKPLNTHYSDINNRMVHSVFPINQDSLPQRILPGDALDSVTKIRDALQENPGAWLIPMDMARLEKFNNQGHTRMVFFVVKCTEGHELPKVMFKTEAKQQNVEFVADEPTVERTTPPSTSDPLIDTSTDKMERPKKCVTYHMNAKPAIIRDRFLDITFACPDPLKPLECKEQVDYAVRLGCITCKPGITQTEQNLFLKTLRKWLNTSAHDDSTEYEDENVKVMIDVALDDLNMWKGTNLTDFLHSPEKPQTIGKIEPGGFRYVTAPKDWAIKACLHNTWGWGWSA